MLGEVLQDLAVTRALLLFAHRHLNGYGQSGLPTCVFECCLQHSSIAEKLNDPFGLDDLAIGPVEDEPFLTVVGWSHTDAEPTAWSEVGLSERRFPVHREHPFHDVRRVGVCLPHEIAWRIEDARQG